MNSRLPSAFAVMLLAALAARAATSAPNSPPSRLSLIGEDYRKAAVLPETFFNPFKVRASNAASLDKGGDAKVTDQTILDAMERRGVSGMIFAPEAADCRAIIGDQVFSVGDELNFSDDAKGADAPLVVGATVVLRDVSARQLALDVTFEGEGPHRLDFPLRTFWRP